MDQLPAIPSETGTDPWQELSAPRIDFLLLADRAEVVNGKLYLMGGAWDAVQVKDLNLPLPLSIALGVLVPWNATNQPHTVDIAIHNADGVPVGFSGQFAFTAGRPPWAEPSHEQRILFALPLASVLFPAYGTYVLHAHINGALARRIPFQVARPG